MNILGVDVGGSGIKGAVVNTINGNLISERIRIPTPSPATPKKISQTIKNICNELKWDGLDTFFESETGNKSFVINDADAAAMGIREFGEGKDHEGLVITITIGTGIGSGVFFNGKLISNFELGRLYGKKGDIMESFASDAARKKNNWDYKKWGKRLNFFLDHIENIFSPDLIILGGGVSKKLELYRNFINIKTPLIAAKLKNNAGIIGASVFAKKMVDLSSKV